MKQNHLFYAKGALLYAAACAVLWTGAAALAQQPSDPIYWCNISRAQVSGERDAALAQIEALKARSAAMEARIKELETARKPQEQ